MSLEDFKSKFSFKPEYTLFVGVERERYITDPAGMPVCRVEEVLRVLNDEARFAPEFNACQIEERVGPIKVSEVKAALQETNKQIESAVDQLGLHSSFEVPGPKDMPLDNYPKKRYQEIAIGLSPEQLEVVARVIGVHVHVGMPDHETALSVYNKVVGHYSELEEMGDLSQGKRIEMFEVVSKERAPQPYKDWQGFYERIAAAGVSHDPTRYWSLIRISPIGTIEFRMFDSTEDIDQVTTWARRCHQLCEQYLKG